MPLVKNSFEKASKTYTKYAYLQENIAKELLDKLSKNFLSMEYESILDLGCGSGFIYKHFNAPYQKFYALDLSPSLLSLHPKNDRVTLICDSFENPSIYNQTFSLITASSSLQWASDLDATLRLIATHSKIVAFSLFTHSSLKEIYTFLSIKSLLPTLEDYKKLINKYFIGDLSTQEYQISFSSRENMLQYLRKSGILGNTRQLNFTQSKRLYKYSPYETLSFEVLFFVGESRGDC